MQNVRNTDIEKLKIKNKKRSQQTENKLKITKFKLKKIITAIRNILPKNQMLQMLTELYNSYHYTTYKITL